jgi:hypothetical protein
MIHVPLLQRKHIWFLPYGPPSHLHTVRQRLNQAFGEQRTGREGPVKWPARSLDLCSPRFLAVGTPKDFGVSAPSSDIEQFQNWVKNACHEIRMKPGICGWVRTSVRRKLQVVLERMGTTGSTAVEITSPHLSGQWFLDICWLGTSAHWSTYYTPLKNANLFLTYAHSCYVLSPSMSVTVVARYKAWNIFSRSNAGIVTSKPT